MERGFLGQGYVGDSAPSWVRDGKVNSLLGLFTSSSLGLLAFSRAVISSQEPCWLCSLLGLSTTT